MKVARWGKEVAEGMDSRLTGGGREELAKGREREEGLEKKSETNFRSSLSSLSLSLSLFLYPSFFSPSPLFPSSSSLPPVQFEKFPLLT